MAKGYWIVLVDVTDPGNYPKYLEAWAEAFEMYKPKYLVRGGRFETPEGEMRARKVVLEFDSYEQAVECYHSPEYQAAAALRHAYANSDLVIVEGTE